MVASMGEELQRLALDRRLTMSGLVAGLDVLTARGLDPERIRQYMPVIAEVAAASGAAEEGLAGLGVAFNRLARIEEPTALRQAYASAFRLGQLGGVELKDMAQYLPGVLAQMRALSITGDRAIINAAASMQVLRDSFGSTSEAAAGLQALLGQLLSEDLVKKMAGLGVNMRGVYADARRRQARGEDIDPVEALMQAVRRGVSRFRARIITLGASLLFTQQRPAWSTRPAP